MELLSLAKLFSLLGVTVIWRRVIVTRWIEGTDIDRGVMCLDIVGASFNDANLEGDEACLS